MMAWALYAVLVAMLMGIAAWMAERSMRRQGKASRWVWLASLIASGALAVLGLQPEWSELHSPAVDTPSTTRQAPDARMRVPDPILRVQAQVERQVQVRALQISELPGSRFVAAAGYVGLSGLMAAALAWNAWTLRRRMQQWRAAMLLGTPVLVAPDAGPAVVGLLRPRIVVPQWLLDATASQQRLVLAHEQAHLDARDPFCLAAVLILLVAMPWNLPLWWQVSRLRRAMEVDCDARVLAQGHSLRSYGELLLAVGQRQSVRLGLSSSMSTSTSFLEQRLTLMFKQRGPSLAGRVAAFSLASLALSLAAAATQMDPPGTALVLSPEALTALDGDYQTAEQEVLHVSHEGQRLFVQSTGRPRVEWQARSGGEFVALNGRQRARAQYDSEGHVSLLKLHLHGIDLSAQRISEAQALRIADGVAARIRKQTASPGTEAAVRRFFTQILMKPANLDGLSPLMIAGVREQNERLRPQFGKLGAVQSVEFAGVSETGYDKYLMRCEHGSVLWDILLDADGTIARVNFTFPNL
ncbi:M56 family metallopeptidase [Paucibacter sp. R3-3]|uniref:M56 family metallopeptidase n=1 Tax=Roseateles agri TaxID=3098619 RepID=A0ABU5DKR4_9BURK|nr:M56 family metallopeptidase [Paucibacter sp. R3-3]MDY0746280.1 M56 family metallopeptidase [Paucibacter sp. R3-3]